MKSIMTDDDKPLEFGEMKGIESQQDSKRASSKVSKKTADLILELDQKVSTSIYLVSMVSPVLETFIDCTLKESEENHDNPCPKITVKIGQHQEWLRKILCNIKIHFSLPPEMIQTNNIIPLLEAALYADIKPIINQCETWLVDKIKQGLFLEFSSNPYQIWEMAYRNNLVSLQEALIQHIAWSNYSTLNVSPPSTSPIAPCWKKLIEKLSTQEQKSRHVTKKRQINFSDMQEY